MEKIKLNGIEEAVKDFNEYQGNAKIMIDKTTGDIWTDKFISNNEWKNYKSDTIKLVYSKDNILDADSKISVEKVKVIASAIMKNDYASYEELIYDIAEELYYTN